MGGPFCGNWERPYPDAGVQEREVAKVYQGRPDFEPWRLGSGGINGNKEIRGEASWDCL